MTGEKTRGDVWAQGDLYEPYVGRWSRLVAREFAQWLNRPRALRWLDVGCGTGALTQTILDECHPASVVGVDVSEGMVQYAQAKTQDARATFRVANAQELRVDSGAFEMVVSGLVLNFASNPERMVSEMRRACRLNGRVALYVWDYAGEMQMMRYFWDAAAQLDPTTRALDEGTRFPLANTRALWNLFLDARLNDVQTRTIDVPTHFKNFDDYWTPFLSGQAPAPHYAMSLSEAKRVELRERLRARLPKERDGSIRLFARALAVRGTR